MNWLRWGENGNKEEIAYLKGGSGMVESVILAIIDTLEGCKKRKEQADANRNPMNKDYLRQMAEVVKSKLPDNFGFLLMAAPLGDNPGRLIYTSTMERKDALNLLKEFLLKNDSAEDWMKHIK